MKKIILIFIILLTLFKGVNANWDKVNFIFYGANITGGINAKIEVTKKTCGNSTKESYSGDISSIMTVKNSGLLDCFNIDGGFSCTFSYTRGRSFGILASFASPEQYIKKDIEIYGKISEILKHIGVPEKVYSKTEGNYSSKYKIKMNLATDYNGDTRSYKYAKLNTPSFDLGSIEYEDNSNCSGNRPGTTTNESGTTTNESGTTTNESGTTTNESGITIKITKTETGDTVELTDNKRSPVIENIEIDGDNCKLIGSIYNCYTTEKLDFTLKLSDRGDNPSGIDRINVFVLNAAGNKALSELNIIEGLNYNSQELNFSYNGSDFFKKEGAYTLEFQGLRTDGESVKNQSKIKNIKVKFVPNPDGLQTKLIDGENGQDVYANYKDKHNYNFTITDKFGNPIYDKKITELKCDGDCIKDTSNKLAVITKDFTGKLDQNGGGKFHIISAVPGITNEKFKGSFKKWDTSYNDLGSGEKTQFIFEKEGKKEFKQPITLDKISIEGGGSDISKKQKYTIILQNPGKLSDYNNGKLDSLSTDKIQLLGNNFSFSGGILNPIISFGNDIGNQIGFSAIIKSNNDDSLLGNPIIRASGINLSYNLEKDGQTYYIKYKLEDKDTLGCNRSTLGLVVKGAIQGNGKYSKSGFSENITDLSKIELREKIRKNAYNFIRPMKSGDKVNGILYIDGNKEYSDIKSELENNDTIIVKNGNFTIDDNIDKTIGIIVLKDNYNVETDYNKTGNIYVKHNVERINAYIYADGGFISGYKENGKLITYSDEDLRKNHLDLKGGLFTRNTIGGGEKGNTGCKLPGGKTTTNCSLAEKYDLHYIRKQIICKKEDYSFKIIHNLDIEINPPVGFRN